MGLEGVRWEQHMTAKLDHEPTYSFHATHKYRLMMYAHSNPVMCRSSIIIDRWSKTLSEAIINYTNSSIDYRGNVEKYIDNKQK